MCERVKNLYKRPCFVIDQELPFTDLVIAHRNSVVSCAHSRTTRPRKRAHSQACHLRTLFT